MAGKLVSNNFRVFLASPYCDSKKNAGKHWYHVLAAIYNNFGVFLTSLYVWTTSFKKWREIWFPTILGYFLQASIANIKKKCGKILVSRVSRHFQLFWGISFTPISGISAVACGIEYHFQWSQPAGISVIICVVARGATTKTKSLDCVIVKFDDSDAGYQQRTKHKDKLMKCNAMDGTPIFKINHQCSIGKLQKGHSAIGSVIQFPLKLCDKIGYRY